MKKFLMFSISLSVFSALANAAPPPACNTLINYTVSSIGAGCELGDKIFSNFGGSLPGNDVFTITANAGGLSSPYDGSFFVNVSDSTGVALSTNFTLTYDVAVDTTLAPLNIINSVGASIQDSNISTATLANTIGLLAGSNVCASPAPQSNDAAGVVSTSPKCNSISATSISVAMNFTYTNNGGGQDQLQVAGDSFTESTTSSTPEPVSMFLFGSGLLAVSLIGRKLVRK